MARRAALAFLVVALAGCGSDDDPAATPEASTPAPLPSVEPTATATPSPTATASPDPEDQPGGAGDEEEARVRARFRVTPKGISPAQVSVPAFLAIELVVDSYLAEPFVVRLEGAPPLSVGAGRTARLDVEGRRPGRYPIDFGEAGQALLITGTEPGP